MTIQKSSQVDSLAGKAKRRPSPPSIHSFLLPGKKPLGNAQLPSGGTSILIKRLALGEAAKRSMPLKTRPLNKLENYLPRPNNTGNGSPF
jgi:hypothetical protein